MSHDVFRCKSMSAGKARKDVDSVRLVVNTLDVVMHMSKVAGYGSSSAVVGQALLIDMESVKGFLIQVQVLEALILFRSSRSLTRITANSVMSNVLWGGTFKFQATFAVDEDEGFNPIWTGWIRG
ncbi:hypothetical protein AXG93_392s1480 [Marchantia polymorpha subsp. ruderalis]|uniref:Uncharacterized protein n=1 Tax=Marchantia polymorpha subsp. ruderalis TaxID=1480154 RepID=A0A176WQC1_MARPO|nr:hypothetical protein AXG93_392s1480 [Marchantia polymorpha subsp. ruderalis]